MNCKNCCNMGCKYRFMPEQYKLAEGLNVKSKAPFRTILHAYLGYAVKCTKYQPDGVE